MSTLEDEPVKLTALTRCTFLKFKQGGDVVQIPSNLFWRYFAHRWVILWYIGGWYCDTHRYCDTVIHIGGWYCDPAETGGGQHFAGGRKTAQINFFPEEKTPEIVENFNMNTRRPNTGLRRELFDRGQAGKWPIRMKNLGKLSIRTKRFGVYPNTHCLHLYQYLKVLQLLIFYFH